MIRLLAVVGIAALGISGWRVANGPYDYQKVSIAPGVYGFSEIKLNSIVSGNVVLVVGSDAALVFDTGHHPPITDRIIEDISQITDRPVRYVVISHWHDDHWTAEGIPAATSSRCFPKAR